MEKLLLKAVIAMSILVSLVACESVGLDNPYTAANDTAVYRVQWTGDRGDLFNMDGENKGTIFAENMRDIDTSYYTNTVNGHRLQGWMYYDPNMNRLYLEDNQGGVGRAINTTTSASVGDTSFVGMAADSRNEKVNMVARGLSREYAIPMQKATVIASALQNYHEAKVSRGFTSPSDVQQNFKKVFGVEYGSAMAAVESFRDGKADRLRELTNNTSVYLGIKPHQAKRFMKDMYGSSLKASGYNPQDLNW